MRLLVLATLFLMLAACGGCGPALSREELGEVHFELPAVPGADEPYELPGLRPRREDERPESQQDDGPEAKQDGAGVPGCTGRASD